MSFADDQLTAVQAFAQTMIVVDDEPAALPAETAVPAVVTTPGRVHSSVRTTSDASQEVDAAKVTHPLDTKSLVDEALNLGLVCAVVTPTAEADGDFVELKKGQHELKIKNQTDPPRLVETMIAPITRLISSAS